MDALKALITANRAVLISNSFSPFCTNAEALLQEVDGSGSVKVVLCDSIEEGKNIEKASEFVSDSNQLPHFYVDGEPYDFNFETATKDTIKWLLVEVGVIENEGESGMAVIAETPVVLVGTSYSPYSEAMEQIFSAFKLKKGGEDRKLKIIHVDEDDNGKELAAAAMYIARKPEKEMPFCFLKGVFAGSLKEIQELKKDMNLEPLLIQAGALESPATDELDEMILNNPVLLLTNQYSAYCLRVEAILEQHETIKGAIKIIDVDSVDNGSGLERAARLKTKQKTLPYIFIGGKATAFEQFILFQKEGKLESTLIEAKAIKEPDTTALNKLLDKKGTLLISNSYSPFCMEAINTLQKYSKTANLNIVDVDELENGNEIIDAARFVTGQKSMPYFFVDGKHLGGGTQIASLDKKGELKGVLT